MDVDKITKALRTLGVEGPAVSLDVLRASGLYNRMQPHEVSAVLNAMAQVMVESNWEGNPHDA